MRLFILASQYHPRGVRGADYAQNPALSDKLLVGFFNPMNDDIQALFSNSILMCSSLLSGVVAQHNLVFRWVSDVRSSQAPAPGTLF